MLPKGMGYQVGNEVSEPERGIYQPFKKEGEKERKRNQPTIWKDTCLLLSIWNMLGSEHTLKGKSPWSDFIDRKIWLFLWGLKVGMWERSPEDLSPKRQDEISVIFSSLGFILFIYKRIHLPGQKTQVWSFDPWVGKIPWRRKCQPTPAFLPRKSHRWRSLVGYSPWGLKESDMA